MSYNKDHNPKYIPFCTKVMDSQPTKTYPQDNERTYTKAILLATLVMVATFGFVSVAYAEEERGSIVGSIVANEHIQIAILVVIVGVAVRTWSGLIGRATKELNLNRIVFTFIIAILTSFHIVLPTLQQIPDTANAELWFTAIIGAILTVIGSDAIGKKAAAQVPKIKNVVTGSNANTFTVTATVPPASDNPIHTAEFDELDDDPGPRGVVK